uniref:Arabidopsis retrotransposon Orf1 C-terminal domain-containing protein n=1 Tax=Brassica oleracea var. oleracea TaxID=109376 RepID=A0A0D3AUG1_BRAOL
MKRTKTSAKKNTQEAGSSQLEKQRPKKWDKSDTTHYNNMKKVAVPATQLACPETMTILGIQADIEGLFQNMGLGQLCNLKEPTYPELVRQFIASAYVTRPDDRHEEGFLAFVVQKVYYEVSFTDLCGLFGLSAGERTYGLYWTSELLNFWETIGTWVYRSSQAKESLIRSPVLRYATRLIGSLLYGTTTAASVTQWELCLLYQGVRHLLPAFGNSTFPPATAFNMGAVLAANLAGYKGKVTKSKSNACGFGAVITRILRHVGVDCKNQEVALDRSNNIAWNYLDVISLVSKEFIAGPHSRIDRDVITRILRHVGVDCKNQEVALDRSNNIAWNYLDVISLVSKEFIAGPHSRIDRDGPYVYVFQDRAKKTLYCHLPQIGLTSLLSEAAVEFLPPATALVDKPSFFTPKYQTKGKGVVDEEGEDEAAQAIPDDSQPHQLLPSDSSQYKLQELPPNATSRQQQHWRDQSIKTNNDMLHKIWAAISRIRPCRCQKDDVVHRDNSPSSSGSGSSGTHR